MYKLQWLLIPICKCVWDITEEKRGLNGRYFLFYLRLFTRFFFFVIRKNTTTTINIQRDWQKRLFYLDFILNASSSLLCYASIALCSLFFFTTHTHVHSLHTPFVGQKKKRKREKKSKTAYRQITMLIVEHTSIHPPTSQMCALSLYCLSFCLCNQHMY
jgi:hypothetical protein